MRMRPRCSAARNRGKAADVAEACVLFEEFLTGTLVRTRCTQCRVRSKSCFTAIAIRSRWDCFRRPRLCCRASPAATVIDPDAGCCGMAGSFGYSRDHFEVSRRDRRTQVCCPPSASRKPGTRRRRVRASPAVIRSRTSPAKPPCIPQCSCGLCSAEASMSLAAISLCALVRRHHYQLHHQAERRRAVAGAGVDHRRLPRRHVKVDEVAAGFPVSYS